MASLRDHLTAAVLIEHDPIARIEAVELEPTDEDRERWEREATAALLRHRFPVSFDYHREPSS